MLRRSSLNQESNTNIKTCFLSNAFSSGDEPLCSVAMRSCARVERGCFLLYYLRDSAFVVVFCQFMLTLILETDALKSRGETERCYRVIHGYDISHLTTTNLASLKRQGVAFQIVKSEQYYRKHLLR